MFSVIRTLRANVRNIRRVSKRSLLLGVEQLEDRLNFATDFGFANSLNTSGGNGTITALTTDLLGNAYVSGTVAGTLDLDFGPGMATISGTYRGFFAKYDSQGTLLWSKSIGGVVPGSTGDAEVDPFGNVYFSGSLWSDGYTGDIDPGPAIVPADTTYASQFILKFDSNGNTLWAGSMTGSATGSAITCDSYGNLYVGGAYFSSQNDFDPGQGFASLTPIGGGDAYIAKISPSGNLIWVYGFGSSAINGNGDYVRDIAVDSVGNIFASGFYLNTVDFDPGGGVANRTAPVGGENFLAKYGPNGDFIWAKSLSGAYTGGGRADPDSIAVDALGNVVAAGQFQSTVDFDPGDSVYPLSATSGNFSQYVCKLDGNGNFLWAKAASTTQSIFLKQMVIGKDQEILTVGYFSGTGDIDPGPNVKTIATMGSTDIYFFHYDQNGDLIEGFGYGGTGNDRAFLITMNQLNGEIFISGIFNGNVDFNPSSNANVLSALNTDAGFIQKFETISSAGIALAYPVDGIAENRSTSSDIRIGDVVLIGKNRTTYSKRLEGEDANYFSLIGSQLMLKSGVLLDYETKPTIVVSIVVDDPGTVATTDASTTFLLDIRDSNEQPTSLNLSAATLPENAGNNVLVGTFTATDPDDGETFTFSLPVGASNNAKFSINGNLLYAKQSFDFEATSSVPIFVRVTDARGLVLDKTFDISIQNVRDATITGRYIFYNRSPSSVFGNGSGNPINLIDLTKSPLLPGDTAYFDQYTNYIRGLNGLLIDFDNFTGTPTANDLRFDTWNGIDSEGFQATSAQPTLTLISDGGTTQSDRLKIEFPDYAIRNTWLRIVILSNANTDLPTEDVFYFGNAVADFDIGNIGSPAIIRANASDTSAVRQNQSPLLNSVDVYNVYDLNKDGRVSATDTSIVRQNQAPALIRLIAAPITLSTNFSQSRAKWLETAPTVAPLRIEFQTQDSDITLPKFSSNRPSAENSYRIVSQLLQVAKISQLADTRIDSSLDFSSSEKDDSVLQAAFTDRLFTRSVFFW